MNPALFYFLQLSIYLFSPTYTGTQKSAVCILREKEPPDLPWAHSLSYSMCSGDLPPVFTVAEEQS
jgi:hypothetical protein